ncbi:ATP-binding cassette domain-containing protein [Lactococcus nasutitermitis]|uniref:ATP-binding cassette domain-containing protein n=1 Tax=Lactococcus nasutitermitis TaxID=1652957 RepID=A0ABV9JCW9_9LACT|nr:ATP-binding cassette domain-containing protein [Lactococcus nasutitermitis]
MQIKIENLTFSYKSKAVLSIHESEFDSGKIYGIVGKNGVGKTTFFKTLTNIITNYSGRISFDEQEVKKNPNLLTKVGIMLDDMELYKSYTGLFNLRYFGGLRGGFDEARALEIAAKLDLTTEQLMGKVSRYSLGMKKKLILLISIMNDAEILIFDEPFRGIDAKSVEWMRSYLLDLKQKGKLILISSHVQEDIESVCDQVYLLAGGDFKASFDLRDTKQLLTYTVVVNEPEKLKTYLTDAGLEPVVTGNNVKFDSTIEDFQKTFRHAVEHGVDFDSIKKESKFADIIKNGEA